MRWINYTAPGEAAGAYGLVEDDRIREVRGTPFDGTAASRPAGCTGWPT